MLHIRSPERIHLINESLYPLKHVMTTVIIIVIINLFVDHLLYIRHSVKFFTCIISFNYHKPLYKKCYYQAHYTD